MATLTTYSRVGTVTFTCDGEGKRAKKVRGASSTLFGAMRIHEGADLSAYKFTDQELDAETGLYSCDAPVPLCRMYSRISSRF